MATVYEPSVVGDGEAVAAEEFALGLAAQYGEIVGSDDGDADADVANAEAEQDRALALSDLQDVLARLRNAHVEKMAVAMRKARAPRGAHRRSMLGLMELSVGIEETVEVLEMDTAGGLYDRLASGEKVYANVRAATGIGKSRILPARLAQRGLNVLMLQMDMGLARQVVAAATEQGVSASCMPARSAGGHVMAMTYADFKASFRTNYGTSTLAGIDVIVADEAHAPVHEVRFVEVVVASFAVRCSILVLSATIGDSDLQALSNVETVHVPVSLMEMVDDGAFRAGSPRCRDRTMLVMATDEQAAQVCEKLRLDGHKAYLLDSAARTREIRAVVAALRPRSAIVRRFVVTVPRFGTGYNLPVAHLYSSGTKVQNRMTPDGRADVEEVPISVDEAKQQAGRIGRGLTDVKGKCYMSVAAGAHTEGRELSPAEEFALYIAIVASGISPRASRREQMRLVPFGLSADAAADIDATAGLPASLVLRFFASDGRVPARYAKGLAVFAEEHQVYRVSKHARPLGYPDWVDMPLGGYFGMDERAMTVKVPYVPSDHGLRAKVAAVCAIAEGWLDSEPVFADCDTDDELPEEAMEAMQHRRMLLPRAREISRREVRTEGPKAVAWSYDVPLANQRRSALDASQVSHGFLEVLRNIDGADVVEYPLGASMPGETVGGRERVQVLASAPGTPVDVESPGGTVVVQLRKEVWERWAAGEVVSPEEACATLRVIKRRTSEFASSLAFSNWSNCWLGVLKTFTDSSVLTQVVREALHPYMASLLMALYARYQSGVDSVVTSSAVRSKFWRRLLDGGSFETRFAKARARGEVDIVQSEAFLKRVNDIRIASADALMACEQVGVFAPQLMIGVQQRLGVMRRTGVEVVDEPTTSRHVRAPSKGKVTLRSYNGESWVVHEDGSQERAEEYNARIRGAVSRDVRDDTSALAQRFRRL